MIDNKPKILILGHGRHGKDTAANYISKKYDLDFVSSSYAALDAIYPVLKMVCNYQSKFALYNTRHENRELWKALISLYNTPDKAALAKHILGLNDMYVGMRCCEEYQASKGFFDHIIWVDRSDYEPDDVSMSILYDPEVMLWLDNNGDHDWLKKNIDLVFRECIAF